MILLSLASFTADRVTKSEKEKERRSPICKTRWTDITYPPLFPINRIEFSHFNIKSKKPHKNRKKQLRFLTKPTASIISKLA